MKDLIENFDIFLRNDAEWESANRQILAKRASAIQTQPPGVRQLQSVVHAEIAYQINLWQQHYEGAVENAGQVLANGRGFVPYIRRDLYAKLLAAANGTTVGGPTAGTHANTTGQSGAGQPSPKRSDKPNYPRDWDSIAVGHVVIAFQEPSWGWYEAIVMEINGDTLTTRWLHYPEERRVTRHRLSVGLLYPNEVPASVPRAQQPEFPSVNATSSAPQTSEDFKPIYPKTWDDIDVDCLVLIKEDGPWYSWWEAVPIAKADHQFLLRWRDHPRLPNVVRSRWSLGLLYPNGR